MSLQGARETGRRILVLEDDEGTAEAVCRGLRDSGYEIARAGDVAAAHRLLGAGRFDAAVLDLMVPGGSGFDVLREVRRSHGGLPVLILTAKDGVDDRVRGLDDGADDYLVKPCAFAELLARIRALLRRTTPRIEPIRVGVLEIDPLGRRVKAGDGPLDLTPTEFDLLSQLVLRRGEVLTRTALLELVWGYRFDPSTNVIDVHVNRLRRKLEAAGAPGIPRTVRGIGYVVD